MVRTALAYLIAGWSGFFVMAVELLGGRLLAPTFGSSIYVWGAIITVFMLALSLGYLAGGRYSMLTPSVRRLGVILIIAALTVVPLLLFAEPMLDAVVARGARSAFRFIAERRRAVLRADVLLRDGLAVRGAPAGAGSQQLGASCRASCTSSRPSAALPARC